MLERKIKLSLSEKKPRSFEQKNGINTNILNAFLSRKEFN